MDDGAGVHEPLDDGIGLLGHGVLPEQRAVRGAPTGDLGLVLDHERQPVQASVRFAGRVARLGVPGRRHRVVAVLVAEGVHLRLHPVDLREELAEVLDG